MGNLDNMLANQQKQSVPSGTTLLRKLVRVYMWIGFVAIVLGLVIFLIGVSDPSDKGDGITGGLAVFFGGLFTIFAGCIGEAIDDIRNNTKK